MRVAETAAGWEAVGEAGWAAEGLAVDLAG